MIQMSIQEQEPLIKRTNEFIEKYGIKKKWLAGKVKIDEQKFSYFCNSRFALSFKQYNNLVDFLNKYEKYMGFVELETNGKKDRGNDDEQEN